ncbi:MAG: carbamoyl phosphate synthase small subunit, partial [Gluconacetobacter diazotrophicus]|nr:carbamoyl phosphate synthase small subunit [Gluconacetobacter diazotrophicus]
MALSVETILDRLGGADAAARLTGVGTEAIRKWRQAGLVPPKHWSAILAATGLSVSDLSAAPIQAPPVHAPPPIGEDGGSAPAADDVPRVPAGATAALVLADGSVFWGRGFGAHTDGDRSVGEVCFCTGLTGYQETLTDPSYAGQLITFTFPHIGNVGANP